MDLLEPWKIDFAMLRMVDSILGDTNDPIKRSYLVIYEVSPFDTTHPYKHTCILYNSLYGIQKNAKIMDDYIYLCLYVLPEWTTYEVGESKQKILDIAKELEC